MQQQHGSAVCEFGRRKLLNITRGAPDMAATRAASRPSTCSAAPARCRAEICSRSQSPSPACCPSGYRPASAHYPARRCGRAPGGVPPTPDCFAYARRAVRGRSGRQSVGLPIRMALSIRRLAFRLVAGLKTPDAALPAHRFGASGYSATSRRIRRNPYTSTSAPRCNAPLRRRD